MTPQNEEAFDACVTALRSILENAPDDVQVSLDERRQVVDINTFSASSKRRGRGRTLSINITIPGEP